MMAKRKPTKKEFSIDALVAFGLAIALYVLQPYIFEFIVWLTETCVTHKVCDV